MLGKAQWGTCAQSLRDLISGETEQCIIWPHRRLPNGYPVIRYENKNQYAHRVALFLTVGKPENETMVARHICGNGNQGCINPKHLCWGTRKENQQDMVAHGRSNRGERSPNSKLTSSMVVYIKRSYVSGKCTKKELAKKYGVCERHIHEIIRGNAWSHISA